MSGACFLIDQPLKGPHIYPMENATSFGAQAEVYAKARPHYPSELFDWIASQAPNREAVWDAGTGSGQAAISLARRFTHVHATDISQEQIEKAPRRANITYGVAQAHNSGLADGSQDAITVATALHWFDFEKFWAEVARVMRPGGLFCAFTYHKAYSDADTHRALIDPVLDVLSPYWSEGNRISWRGYRVEDVKIPFPLIKSPDFVCELDWTPAQIIDMMRSMSAHKKARLDGHETLLNAIEAKALKSLGEAPRSYNLPINMIAARINAEHA